MTINEVSAEIAKLNDRFRKDETFSVTQGVFYLRVSSSHFPGHPVCLKLLFVERSGVSRWAHF